MKKALGRKLMFIGVLTQIVCWGWSFFCWHMGLDNQEGWAYFAFVGWLFVFLGFLQLLLKQKTSCFYGNYIIVLGMFFLLWADALGLWENAHWGLYGLHKWLIFIFSWIIYRVGLDIIENR